MEEICKIDSCTGCGLCRKVCPVSCISMKENAEGYNYPEINNQKCINCGKCTRMCPSNNEFNKHPGSFYMGWHKDDNVLLKSSSGGAMTALAQITFERGGVVFGAYMDPDSHEIYHVEIDSEENLDCIRLSKYYQGVSSDTYPRVKELISRKTPVMFTGVACQIAGLLSYLGKEKNSRYLLTVEVLCHGVANKSIVNGYLNDKQKKIHKKMNDYRFRVKPKDSDWWSGGGTRMRVDFNDGTRFVDNKETGTYFVGFNHYLFLRKSCYECRYVGTERISDITLADFWGVDQEKITQHEKSLGVSVITLNTNKAKELLEDLQGKMVIEPVDQKEVIPYNQAFSKPATVNPNREHFFELFKIVGFDKAVHKCESKYYTKLRIRKAVIAILGQEKYEKLKNKVLGK